METFHSSSERGKTIVLITHDPGIAAALTVPYLTATVAFTTARRTHAPAHLRSAVDSLPMTPPANLLKGSGGMSARDLIQEALHSLSQQGAQPAQRSWALSSASPVIAMTSLIGGIQNSLVNSLLP